MLSGFDLLARLTALGIEVLRDGDRIGLRPKDRVTTEIREAVKEHKPEILSALKDPSEEAYSILRGILAGLPGARLRFLESTKQFSVNLESVSFLDRDAEAASALEIGFWLCKADPFLRRNLGRLTEEGAVVFVPAPRPPAPRKGRGT